ncbi:MAG: LysE family translocator [Bacteroidota bacterium]|nr:LysE family translocator [Bacteroidota bacterium]
MIIAIIKGFIFGLSLAIIAGPSFFALIQTSLKHGFKTGFHFASGIFISDSAWAMLIYWGIFSLIPIHGDKTIASTIASIVGGSVLIIFGIITIYRSKHFVIKNEDADSDKNNVSNYLYVIKGFLMNMLNPAVFIFWVSTDSFANRHFDSNLIAIVFLITILITNYIADIVKSHISHRISRNLEAHWIIRVNRIAGIVLIIIGMYIALEKFIN